MRFQLVAAFVLLLAVTPAHLYAAANLFALRSPRTYKAPGRLVARGLPLLGFITAAVFGIVAYFRDDGDVMLLAFVFMLLSTGSLLVLRQRPKA